MKISEMNANNVKTSFLQRQFRKWHQRCVFNGSELIVNFKAPKGKRIKEHMATCSGCLIGRDEDIGFSPPSISEFRADSPQNKGVKQ